MLASAWLVDRLINQLLSAARLGSTVGNPMSEGEGAVVVESPVSSLKPFEP